MRSYGEIKKTNVCTCIHRHFWECLHMYEGSGEGSQKKDNEINWGRRVETVGQRAAVSPDHQTRVKEMRNEEAGTCYCSQPNASLICPSASISRHHIASGPSFSLMWFHVIDPASPILCFFFLTVWWLLSLLCCHGNLWEIVGTHYIYFLSFLFENELSVFCLGCHENCVLTPESWNLYIQDA